MPVAAIIGDVSKLLEGRDRTPCGPSRYGRHGVASLPEIVWIHIQRASEFSGNLLALKELSTDLESHCRRKLEEAESAGLLRSLHTTSVMRGPCVQWDNQQFLDFASNDYLGFSGHPSLRAVLMEKNEESVGARASRLITGNHPAYDLLEKELADFKGSEAALVFSSGYAAALGTIPALVGDGDFIVMDKLSHACLVDGARLSGAKIRVFPHNNIKRCGELLEICRRSGGTPAKILLVTESVFSMDGDLAPLADLVELKNRYKGWLMVDEAHATGVMGDHGRGGGEAAAVEGQIEISMGTLSKALGCVGGFICGSDLLKRLLVNRARSFIFSTGLPPAVCRVGAAAVELARTGKDARQRLWKNIRWMESQLGLQLFSPIVPIMVGDEARCVQLAAECRRHGIMVPAVRYPTVGKGKARLRLSLSAGHSQADLEKLLEVLRLCKLV